MGARANPITRRTTGRASHRDMAWTRGATKASAERLIFVPEELAPGMRGQGGVPWYAGAVEV